MAAFTILPASRWFPASFPSPKVLGDCVGVVERLRQLVRVLPAPILPAPLPPRPGCLLRMATVGSP